MQSISRLRTRADLLLLIWSLLEVNVLILAAQNDPKVPQSQSLNAMNRNLSLASSSTQSDVVHVERSSEDSSPFRNNTPAVLNSMQLSGPLARDTITISSVASSKAQFVSIDSDSNKPTIPFAFGNQHPIVPPSLNDLNLLPNLFNLLGYYGRNSTKRGTKPQSPEQYHPYPISTPLLNLSTIEGWETPHTTTNENTSYSEGEPERVYLHTSSNETFDSDEPRQISFTSSPSSTPPPPRHRKR